MDAPYAIFSVLLLTRPLWVVVHYVGERVPFGVSIHSIIRLKLNQSIVTTNPTIGNNTKETIS